MKWNENSMRASPTSHGPAARTVWPARRCSGLRAFRRQARPAGPHSASSSHAHACGRQEFRRLAVAQGDGAGLVQQQHIHVACGLNRPAAHGQARFSAPCRSIPAMPMALKSPPMVVGIRHTSSAVSTVIGQ
ncbi:MAG: hypothetical protein MZV70_57350 [Desulfobacterales bacterium]|nr:hypothetical protein [Desulfobacterales bacterium]